MKFFLFALIKLIYFFLGRINETFHSKLDNILILIIIFLILIIILKLIIQN